MPKCANKGCGKEYEQENNTDASCRYHPGNPIFHEGLKSWSCCSDTNRPVLDFESFMAISGCTKGRHAEPKPKEEIPSSQPVSAASSSTVAAVRVNVAEDGTETFSTASANPTIVPQTALVSNTSQAPSAPIEEEDDPSIEVSVGTPCRRRGCSAKFISQEESRLGDKENSLCVYHPSPPIFHEGSKGYLCCKRRVLEFDEFLKIKGCKTGKHVFATKIDKESTTEDLVDCRIDHYQTPSQVHVSVFAKQTDKVASKVELGEDKVSLDLLMPGRKRFKRTIDLYGPIDPTTSKYTLLGTKVELTLTKADKRSWPILEKTSRPIEGYNLTFGVTGRTGTIGGKELILSEENKARLG